MVESGNSRRVVLDLGVATHYVADTGPLLCLGGSPVLRRSLAARLAGKAHWVRAVRDELARFAQRSDPLGKAAKSYSGTGAAWLSTVAEFTGADDAHLRPIMDRLRALASEKARTRGQVKNFHRKENLGEAQSILHAMRNGQTLLAHDNDARRVAIENGVPATTLVSLARRLVAEGAEPRELAACFLSLQASNIDTGQTIRGQLDLMPRRVR